MLNNILVNTSGIGDTISRLIAANPLLQKANVTYVINGKFKGHLKGTKFKEVVHDRLPDDRFDLLIDMTSNKYRRNITINSRPKGRMEDIVNTFIKSVFGKFAGKRQPIFQNMIISCGTIGPFALI